MKQNAHATCAERSEEAIAVARAVTSTQGCFLQSQGLQINLGNILKGKSAVLWMGFDCPWRLEPFLTSMYGALSVRLYISMGQGQKLRSTASVIQSELCFDPAFYIVSW